MFFIMGISQGQKQLPYARTVICNICGKYGRYEVFMTYTCLSLFFIPVFKWGKRYIVKSSCCGTMYELNPEKGKLLAKGVEIEILGSDLTHINGRNGGWRFSQRCSNCGYEAEADFEFCPKCGRKL